MMMLLMLIVESCEFMHCRVIWDINAFMVSTSDGEKWWCHHSV